MKLSIIVPAYKVESYIERCIRSLEDQNLPKEEYEIIVVNDGSPDRCGEIVEGLQKEFSNIVLINQENQGVSMARNNGIARARGKYIMPVDPDDYVLPRQFDEIIRRAEAEDLDVLYVGMDILGEQGELEWSTDYALQENKVYQGPEGYSASRGKNVRDPDASYSKVYKKTLLKDFAVTYPKDVPYLEDGLFLLKVFTVAKRVGFRASVLYQRTTRPGSATHSNLLFSEKALNGFIIAAKDLRAFAQRISLSQEQRDLINQGIVKFAILPLTAAISNKSVSKYFKVVKKLKDNGFGKLELPKRKNRYYYYAKMYNRSILLFPFFLVKYQYSLNK